MVNNVEGSIFHLAGYALLVLAILIASSLIIGLMTLPAFFFVIFLCDLFLRLLDRTGLLVVKVARLLLRGLLRNLLRTSLTYLALFVLTFVLAMLFTVVEFLGRMLAEKDQDLKVIMTEKYSNPSALPPHYERRVIDLFGELPAESRPKNGAADVMTWSFAAGTTDITNPRPENALFFFAVEPDKILTMMDGLERKDLNPDELAKMEENVRLMNDDPQAIICSESRLKKMNLAVGERIKMASLFQKDITFEFHIVGTLPQGKFEGVSMMNRKYLLSLIDAYHRDKGVAHPLASKSVNFVWVRLPNKKAYEQLAALVNDPKNFSGPEVKLETASAFLAGIFESYKDIIWALKYLLSPAMMAIMTLVIANAISIGVRERRTELAVMKVLGFRPWHVAMMVLAEGMLIGLLAGGMSTIIAWFFIGSFKMQIAFLGSFFVPWYVIPLGIAMGVGVAFLGSVGPAMSARTVKAVEVFSKVG